MISLIQAIRLLGINDSEGITLSTKHGDIFMPHFIVQEVRKRFDMKNIRVYKVYRYRSIYDTEINWEFIVDKKTIELAKEIYQCRK